MLGATGRTHALATDYLMILLPTLPMLALGMTSSAVLRSVGDARRAMHVTLLGASSTPFSMLFSFSISAGASRARPSLRPSRGSRSWRVGLYGVIRIHNLMGRPKMATLTDRRAGILLRSLFQPF